MRMFIIGFHPDLTGKPPIMHLALSGVFLLLGEDKYYLSLAYYHFYPFFKGYTCKNKFFYDIMYSTLQSKEGP